MLAVLLTIAIPTYIGFDGRASKSAAQANLRTALPALAAFHSDNDSYAGLTVAALKGYDQGVSPGITVVSSSAVDVLPALDPPRPGLLQERAERRHHHDRVQLTPRRGNVL